MRYLIKRITPAFCMFFTLLAYGCGLKPFPGSPEDVTISQVLAAIEKHSTLIEDFSGTALVKAKLKSEPSQSVKVSIRYIRPDNFRVVIKGFAGITGALISTCSDSMNIYFPSENTFITEERNNDILRLIVPGINVDFEQITSILTGMLPSPDERDQYQKSLKHSGKRVVLQLIRGTTLHSYILEGKEMRVVGEEILQDGVTVWRKEASGFRNVDGVVFPRKISIRNEHGIIDMEFSGCSINSGLTENDLSFVIPSSAERIFFEKQQQN